MSLQISKRDGSLVSYNPSKILTRIRRSAKGLQINETEIFAKVITSMPTEGVVSTKQLDNLVAELSAAYTGTHYDYSRFAANVAISSYHKETLPSFSETMYKLGKDGIVNSELLKIIDTYGPEKIEEQIDYAYDYNFDFFAWKSLEKMYLLKSSEGVLTERPQHMYMRVALWVTKTFEEAIEYYQSLCNQRISPATPIMINAGTMQAQLSSCVLIMNEADSRQGLKSSFNDSADYSADAAGIGLCMSNIRSKESKIASSGGNAGGLLKYLKIINESMRFFNQQGKRPGSAAIYIEPWHKDIIDLLELKKNTGAEEMRAKDLFTALWVPDNFMRALEADSDWYLFCPNDIKKAGLKPLHEVHSEEYEAVYNKAVELGLGKKVKAKDIAIKIVESQIETGVPYILFKDHANKKSNHKNLGTIKQSNLCAEIIQYTDFETTAICTLSSMILKNFINDKAFDFDLLYNEVRKVTRALNKVIDINHYSTVKGRKGGLEQRAIGIGIQGLADTFFLLDLIYTSDEAKELNKRISETIYFAALTESMELCKSKEYEPYKSFEGSPISQGIFQFDMWGVEANMWDWEKLRQDIKKYGVCNSLVTCLMPTASSSRPSNSYEKEEPPTLNIFNRRVTGGEFTICNSYLINDLEKLNLWNEQIKSEIIINNGSIQGINFNKYLDSEDRRYESKVKRVEFLIQKYRTAWEIPQKEIINMAADRGPFIDQSQSMNIYMGAPTASKLLSSMLYAWKKGLKTGSYYIRTRAISTGAKHLGIDMSAMTPTIVPEGVKTTSHTVVLTQEEIELNNLIALEMSKNISKPEDTEVDCFGCSS